MVNNDILRRIRYTFDLSDNKMMSVFALAGKKVSREEISNWLKKEDAPTFQTCNDKVLATFLNGFIIERRGKRDKPQPQAEDYLTNNLIFKKLRIALNFKDDDILNVLALVGLKISKHELSAFFRSPEHRQSRQCKDQVLRNFLHGLQVKYRPKNETTSAHAEKKVSTNKTLTPPKPKFQWKEK